MRIKNKMADLMQSDAAMVFALVLFTIMIRLITLPVIEDSGDHIFYWTAARQFLQSGCTMELNHWSTRFGVVIPVLISVAILGIQPLVMYAVPLLMSVLQTIGLYFLGLHIGERKTAIPLVLFFVLYPTMVRNGSLILPGIFSSTYLTFAALCIFRYLDSEGEGIQYIVLSSLLLFAAYETHIICVFAIPGFMLTLWKGKNRMRDLALFTGILFCLLFAEFLLYYIMTGSLSGQLGIIVHSHIEKNTERLAATSFMGLFYRFVRPGPHFTLLFIMYLAACVNFLKKEFSPKIRMLVYSSLFFFFALTFAIKSINPITPVINTQIRYLDPALPFFFCIIVYFAVVLLYENSNRQAAIGLGVAAAVIVSVAAYGFIHRSSFSRHALCIISETNSLADTAAAANIPLVYSASDTEKYQKLVEVYGKTTNRAYNREYLDKYGLASQDYTDLQHHTTRMNRSIRMLTNLYWDDRLPCGRQMDTSLFRIQTVTHNKRPHLVFTHGNTGFNAAEYFSHARNSVMLVDRLPTRLRMGRVMDIDTSFDDQPADGF